MIIMFFLSRRATVSKINAPNADVDLINNVACKPFVNDEIDK